MPFRPIGADFRHQRSQLRSKSKEILRPAVSDPVGPELHRAAGAILDGGAVHASERVARWAVSQNGIVFPGALAGEES